MCKTLGKKFIIAALAVVMTLSVFGTLAVGINNASASKRESVIFSENFKGSELSSKWIDVDNSEGETEKDKISPLSAGLNGTLKMNYQSAWGGSHVIYYDKDVTVADDEDLIIEYSIANLDYGDIFERSGTNAFVGLVKGLTDLQGTVASDIDAKLEAIGYAIFEGHSYAGYQLNALGWSRFSAGEGASSYSFGISDSARSDAVKQYYKTNMYTGNWVGNNDGSTAAKSVIWYGENMFAGLSLGVNDPVSIFEKGFTFKHVYKATGGYDCYVKANEADDSAYKKFMTLSDTLGDTGEKRFSIRSGKIGFVVCETPISIEFDELNVYTAKGEEVTAVVEETFNPDSLGNRYEATDWKCTTANTSLVEASVGEAGFLFNNPSENRYIYTSSSANKIIYDGNYDNYATLNVKFSIQELTEGKNIGFLFGGSKTTEIFNKNDNVYVYLTKESGKSNYSLGVDLVVDGARVRIGDLRDSGIPETAKGASPAKYGLNIVGKLGGKITVEVVDALGATVGSVHEFGEEGKSLILKNRYAIYTAGTSGSAIFVMNGFSVSNKYYKTFELFGDTVNVSENFDGKYHVDESGNIEFENVTVWKSAAVKGVPDAGTYIEDGSVWFKGVGDGASIMTNSVYNDFVMYFDLTDMQRKRVLNEDGSTNTPISTAPLIIFLGGSANKPEHAPISLVIYSPMNKSMNATDVIDADPATGADNYTNSWVALHRDGMTPIEAGKARINFLDESLDGKTVRFKVEYKDSKVSLGYYIVGEEDADLLDTPIVDNIYAEGGEGYVSISSTHSPTTMLSANFKIDNLKICDTSLFSTLKTVDVVVPEEKKEETPEKSGCGS